MSIDIQAGLAIVQGCLAFGMLVFGYQRWQMGQLAAAMLCFALSTYFGRICLLWAGRAWEVSRLESAATAHAIMLNALMVLVALLLAIAEAHEQGFAAWRRRWKERHK